LDEFLYEERFDEKVEELILCQEEEFGELY
jgi:hypothetical protein